MNIKTLKVKLKLLNKDLLNKFLLAFSNKFLLTFRNSLRFFSEKKGSISVESALIFGILLVLIIVVADTGKALVAKAKLDRLSYSLASIIRDRSLYEFSNTVSREEASSLYRIMKYLQKDFLSKDSDISLNLDILYFKPPSASSAPSVKNIASFNFGDEECKSPVDMDSYTNLGVIGSDKQYVPVIRVITCMKQQSTFLPSSNVVSDLLPIQGLSLVLQR